MNDRTKERIEALELDLDYEERRIAEGYTKIAEQATKLLAEKVLDPMTDWIAHYQTQIQDARRRIALIQARLDEIAKGGAA